MGARQEWEHQARQVLRKAQRLSPDSPDDQVWAALSATTVEGVPVPPLGLAGRTLPLDDGRRRAAAGWTVRPHIVVPDPSAAADDLFQEWEHESASVWLTVGGSGTDTAVLGRALSRVPLNTLPVVLGATGTTTDVQAAQAFSDVLQRRGVRPAEGGSLGADPVGRLLRTGSSSPGSAVDAVIRDIAAVAMDLGVGALVADGTTAHLRGAGEAAEIGFVLAAGVYYIRELERRGYPLHQALGLIALRLAATDDQFATMAKFRVARLLWTRIADLSGAKPGWASGIHAVTSTPMMTRYDPWTNLLRTTVAAFAAGTGGADALTVQPFDVALGIPDGQGRRLARNISALLIQEGHVADVADPAGGSWAVETLTDSLADAAWAEFLRIETGGGVMTAVLDGSLRSRYGGTRERRTARVNTRTQAISGVTEFPQSDEKLLRREPYPTVPAEDDAADISSWAAGFEALRDDPPPERVFLATIGPRAAHAARVGFLTNALAAGGVGVTPADTTGSVEDLLVAFAAHPGAVVCLAGTDAAYVQSAAPIISTLRDAGARRLILAGRPSAELDALVDDHIAAGDDVLAFLHRTRAALSGSVPTSQGVTP